MEEGQLVEIYIEREKEFALVGSIYKEKFTRVLRAASPRSWTSAWTATILYVSDVFENLEGTTTVTTSWPQRSRSMSAPPRRRKRNAAIELLPGESLGRAHESAPSVISHDSEHADPEDHDIRTHVEQIHAAVKYRAKPRRALEQF